MKTVRAKKQPAQAATGGKVAQRGIRKILQQAERMRAQIAGHLTPEKLSAFKNEGRR